MLPGAQAPLQYTILAFTWLELPLAYSNYQSCLAALAYPMGVPVAGLIGVGGRANNIANTPSHPGPLLQVS